MTVLAQHSWLLVPLAVLLAVAFIFLLVPLAHKFGWVDHPNARKVHDDATPLVGGVAIFMALSGLIWLSPISTLASGPFYLVLLWGAFAMLLTGLVDDLIGLTATIRFIIQIGLCLLMVRYAHVHLTDFGQLFTSSVFTLGWAAVPITVFAAMGVINAFNLIDGMDGLSGTIFLIAAAGMLLFAVLSADWAVFWLLLITMASVLGFLLLNARLPWNEKARVFLGDAGALMLGFILAWCFIRLGSGSEPAMMPMTAVWLFALPLLDTSTLIWLRWRDGRSAFSADQHHLHHAFLRAGYSVGQTWAVMLLLASGLAVIGIGFEFSGLPDWLSFYTFMALAFVYYFYVKHSWATQCFLGRHFIHHDFTIEEGYA